MRVTQQIVAVISALLLAGIVVVVLFIDTVGERTITESALTETQVQIRLFLNRNGRLPENLEALPFRDGFANRTTDGWKRRLIYQVQGDTFMLASFGRDGVEGGKDDDADSFRKFRVENGVIEHVP